VAGINNGEVMAGLMDVIARIHCGDDVARGESLLQFNDFRSQSGVFAKPAAQDLAQPESSYEYWNMIGGEAAALRKVAMRILSKEASSSPCECKWSAFEAAQSPKRNRLKTSTLNDLVYTRVNLRLMQPRLDADYTDTVAEWAAESVANAEATEVNGATADTSDSDGANQSTSSDDDVDDDDNVAETGAASGVGRTPAN
jgi:hAT family C-terminal dimerisation region